MAPSYNDSGLTNGQTVYYTVVAVDNTGEGANSAQQSATPAAVTLSASAQLRTRVHVGASAVVIVRATGALRVQVHLAPRATLVQLTGAVLRTQARFVATAGPPSLSPHAALSITMLLRGTGSAVVVPAVGVLRVQNRLTAITPIVVRQGSASLLLQSQLQATYGIFTGGWGAGAWSEGGFGGGAWGTEGWSEGATGEPWGSPPIPTASFTTRTQLAATAVVIRQAAARLSLQGHLGASAAALIVPAAVSLTDRIRLRATGIAVKAVSGSLLSQVRLQANAIQVVSATAAFVMRSSLQGFQGISEEAAVARLNTRAQLSGVGIAVQLATASLTVQATLTVSSAVIVLSASSSLTVRTRLSSTAAALISPASGSLTTQNRLRGHGASIEPGFASLRQQMRLSGSAAIARNGSASLNIQQSMTATATQVLALSSARFSVTTSLSGSVAAVVVNSTAALVVDTSLRSIGSGPLINPAMANITANFYLQATAVYVVVTSALLETTFRMVSQPALPIVVLDDAANLGIAARLVANGSPTGAVQGATFTVSVEETSTLTTMVGSP